MLYYNLLPWVGTGKDAYAYIDQTQFKEEIVKKVIDGEEIGPEEIRFDLIGLKNVSKRFPDLMGTGSTEWFISDKFRDIIESMGSPERVRFVRGMFARKPEHYNFVNILNNVTGVRLSLGQT